MIASAHKMPAFSEADVVASITTERFYSFVQEFWHTIIDEEPVWNWHMEYLCDELQIVAERVFAKEEKEYDLIVNIPPGTSKSTICSVMFPAWTWTRMPSCRSICASYSYSLAMDLSRKGRDLVQSETIGDEENLRPGYQACFPHIKLRDDQNTKGYFANTRKGMRYSVGTGGAVTGMHGHFLIVDDPLNPLEAASEADLKSCNYWMTETLPSRKVDKRIVPMILIQQRLGEADPTGERLAKKDGPPFKHICLPAEVEDGPKPKHLASRYINGLLDPVRMPLNILRAEEKTLGLFGYACQYRQRPAPRGGGVFKVDRLHYGKAPRGPAFWKRVVRYWDKAGTKDAGAYTVGALLGIDINDKLWVLDIVRGQWESAEREAVILRTSKQDRRMYGRGYIIAMEQEPGSGGKDSARDSVKRLRGFRVRLDLPKGDKVQRADPFATQVNEGLVYVNEGEWNRDYVKELEFFPASKYKDQTDASSGAFSQLVVRQRPRRTRKAA